MSKNYYACIYGGASDKIADKYKDSVEALAGIIVKNGYSLVYGAGSTGCMGAAARGFRDAGGYIMGVAPYFISEFEDIYDCDNTIMVDTMSERKIIMEKQADVFIIVPGGIGTMDEFFQVLTLKYLKRLTAPIIILNTCGFYDSLIALIDSLIAENAVEKKIRSSFEVIKDHSDPRLTEILEMVKNS